MNIVYYPTAEETAEKLAMLIAQEIANNNIYHLALSGGKDAVPIYKALVKQDIEWSKVHIYFTYEIVKGLGVGFNYTLAKGHLLSRIAIPEENIHPIRTEVDPNEEAKRYAKEELKNLPKLEGRPRFDRALIEMTTDGHTVGIYPQQEGLYHSEEDYLINQHPSKDMQVVTISFATLEVAKQIAFYTFGGDARFIIGNIINLMAEAKEYPANYLMAHTPWIYLYTDRMSMSEKSYAIY